MKRMKELRRSDIDAMMKEEQLLKSRLKIEGQTNDMLHTRVQELEKELQEQKEKFLAELNAKGDFLKFMNSEIASPHYLPQVRTFEECRQRIERIIKDWEKTEESLIISLGESNQAAKEMLGAHAMIMKQAEFLSQL